MCIRLFVQILKTAGTSFRSGTERALGAQRIVYGYGAGSPETSATTKKHVYQGQDFWRFYSAGYESVVAIIGGYMNCNCFVAGFGVENFIAFVRGALWRIALKYQDWRYAYRVLIFRLAI
jgi:hypothetical protein